MIRSELQRRGALAGAFLCMSMAFGGVPTDSSLLSGLVWRNIGPFRGGRVSAVSGAVGHPGVFYAGYPLGGVWKTTGAGTTWTPVFDSIKDASSVGAVEVAPSNPNVIYVGMGDMVTGGGINEGNGVYKSTDAGKSWTHLGLEETKQIPSILVDPHDPDLVLVATQGNLHRQSEERGLFRSTNGGKTWNKTLYVENETGVQKIAWAFDNPSVMLATTVRHYNAPNAAGRGGGGGGFGGRGAAPDTNTFLYKSTDEGLTWKKLTGGGLPALSGRTCVAIAMHTRGQRMFLVQNSGLYRSDDGGASWRQMDATDQRVRNGQGGYNCGVYVNSEDPDTVYVINTSSYISHDGGKTFTGFKGAPGGDDPQQMWIDPTDGKRLFLGTDQGATVSLDGGLTWSSWYNQPTAQVYHISVDNSYPYWVYATQQDSGAIATRSRGDLGEITPLDWLPTPGYEFGSIVADPLNPKVIYSGGPGRGIVKITYPSGQWINVSPNADAGLRLRQVGNQPIVYSPTNPREMMVGFQFLMATTDGGMHWKKLSPDLGYPKGVKPPDDNPAPPKPAAKSTTPATKAGDAKAGAAKAVGGNVEEDDQDDETDPDQLDEQAPGTNGGSIESFSPSSVDGGLIWVGTNNGLIKLTKNHGTTWDDVTIPHLPNPTRADISCIEASHEDPATAYAAIDYHTTGDYNPYFYRTTDFGQTWTKIVDGLPTDLPSGSFSRVIRSDTKRAGLLFAGTESFVYVSFDNGDHWQSLALNLPNTSYRDMVVKGNDLVVGTYGRGFWVLDDIAPLRQLASSDLQEAVHLYKPSEAIRVRRNTNGDTPFPPEVPHALNPPEGAILYYTLGAKPSGDLTLDILDSAGHVVRHMSSAPIPASHEGPPPVPDFWIAQPKPMPMDVGLNRINWDLRYDNPPAFGHSYEINANPGLTPPSPQGPLALPGVYTVRLSVDGRAHSQPLTVKNDPRSPAKSSDLHAQGELQSKLYRCAEEAWLGYKAVDKLKNAVTDLVGDDAAEDLAAASEAFIAKLTSVGGAGGGRRGFGGGFGRGGGAPQAPTFARVVSAVTGELNTLDSGDMAPNAPTQKASHSILADLKTAQTAWQNLLKKDLPAFNAVLAKHKLKAIEP
ncbi:MAG: hypothetical protein P4L46_06100 [Fimbriimonas sp.]|nr:hypothetical protein [Fimbriimonas sp.]